MFQQAFYCVALVDTIWQRELNDLDILCIHVPTHAKNAPDRASGWGGGRNRMLHRPPPDARAGPGPTTCPRASTKNVSHILLTIYYYVRIKCCIELKQTFATNHPPIMETIY